MIRIRYINRNGKVLLLGQQASGAPIDGNLAAHGIPDLWHLAQAIRRGEDLGEVHLADRERFAEALEATWHLAHDLADVITGEGKARLTATAGQLGIVRAQS